MTTHLRVSQDLAEQNAVSYQKFGIVGDGKHFDHAGLELLFEAIDEGGRLVMLDSPVMLLGETVDWRRLRGRIFTSGRSSLPDGIGVPRFRWDGAPNGTMWQWDRVNACSLDGIAIETDVRGHAPAGVAIDFDGDQDMHPGEHEIGSRCTLSRIRHLTNAPDPDVTVDRAELAVPAPIFLAIGTLAQKNQEYHSVEQCSGNGNNAGTLVFQGRSPNIVATRIVDVHGTAYKRGIYMHGGSMHLDVVNLTRCEWALWLENGSQVSTLARVVGESNQHWAYIDAPIDAFGNKWDPSSAAVDAVGRGFIHFGPMASRIALRGQLDKNLVDGVPLFTFDNDGSDRRVDIDVIPPRDTRLTRAQLGIDRAALLGKGNPKNQARYVRFRTNPGVVTDLLGGHLEFNWPASVIETAPNDWVNELPVMRKLSKTPVDYTALTPGVSGEHIDTASGTIRQRARFSDGSVSDTPLGTYKKVKP